MNRGRARYSYSTMYDEEDQRRRPIKQKKGVEEPAYCPCSQRSGNCTSCQTPHAYTASVQALDSLDFKQMLLFAGVGILFVVVVDAIVRLSTRGQTGASAGAITIDGRTYVPI